VLETYQKQDELITLLSKLKFNNAIENTILLQQEDRLRKKTREIAQFMARTLRAMRKKVADKNPGAAQAATDAAAPVSAPVPLAEAA